MMSQNSIKVEAGFQVRLVISVLICVVMVGALLVSIAMSIPGYAASQARERVSVNAGWLFQRGDPQEVAGRLDYAAIKERLLKSTVPGNATKTSSSQAENLGGDISYVQPGFNDRNWRKLDLPHDWGIEGPFKQEYQGETGKLAWWGVGWYRKHLNIPAADRGKRIFLDIDGAMAYSTVWMNGCFVGGWPYGYASFRLDLTLYVNYGSENVIAIRLDNPPDSSRWYPGGGIYRNVWLVKTNPVHIGHWGTFVTTPEVADKRAGIEIQIAVDNQSEAESEIIVRTDIYGLSDKSDRLGRPVASARPITLRIPAGASQTGKVQMTIDRPLLWTLENRHLYSAVTTIVQQGVEIDRYETVFGIRTIRFDPARGFLLNGKPTRLNGVCNHHDLGALGTAINLRALERQIELLKEIGVNAIRTSHNPPAPELLDLCDRMGLVVIVEAFDCWKTGKKPNDYHKLFPDWHEKDLRAMVRRDRNHPSVVLWSTGNEVREQRSSEGHKISENLAGIVRDEDSTRPVTAGCDFIGAGYNGFQKTLDVFGYNYKPLEYKKFNQNNPATPLLSSESASCISSRGEYFFPVSDDKAQGKANYQMSSYDLYAPRWATTPDTEFKGQDENPFVAGEFVWTGFDYLGEPTPYGDAAAPSRSSYFGILDLCGFKKDRAYAYQARWRPELPMVHIFPHWNWPDRIGEVTPVHAYTSGDEVELFLNGKSLGRKKKQPLEYRLRWDDVKYQPGELRAVAYKGGKYWAEEKAKTTGPAVNLLLKPDRRMIKADGADLSFVTVTVADKDKLMVPRSDNLIQFEISGPGDIVAVDNGDATSHDSFQARQRKAYNGLCLVIIRSRDKGAGTIILRARSQGLSSAETRIRVVSAGR